MIGDVAAGLQRAHGVDLRCGVTVTALEGDVDGRLRRAHLSDGTTRRRRRGRGRARRDPQHRVAARLRPGRRPVGRRLRRGLPGLRRQRLVTDDVFVAGDVARFPHPLYDYQFLALEHWGNAVAQAEIAAHNMVSAPERPVAAPGRPGVLVVAVRHRTSSRSACRPSPTRSSSPRGRCRERRFVAVYGRHGRITAAVAFDQAKWLEFYQQLIETAAPFPPEFTAFDQPAAAPGPCPWPCPLRRSATSQATVVVTGHDPGERRAELLYHDH